MGGGGRLRTAPWLSGAMAVPLGAAYPWSLRAACSARRLFVGPSGTMIEAPIHPVLRERVGRESTYARLDDTTLHRWSRLKL